MHAIIVDLNQVRCNFCFNWIAGRNLVKKGFNCCMDCLTLYLNQHVQVHTPAGTTYHIHFSKFVKWTDAEQKSENEHFQTEEEKNSDLRRKQNKNERKSNNPHYTAKSSESAIFDVKISDIPKVTGQSAQNFMDFVRAINTVTSKSLLVPKDDPSQGKSHQSLIFNTPSKSKQKTEFLSLNKMLKLQDFGRSLDRTRFIQKYQYFYDTQAIQQFIQVHPKIQQRSQCSKQFGNQVCTNDMDKSVSLKNKLGKSKSSRSNFSNDSHFKSQKMNQESIKSKHKCQRCEKKHMRI